MPERTYGTVVTDTGTRLGVIAVQTGTKVNITTLAVGDGGGSYYQPVPAQAELKNQTWSGAVKSVSINEDSPNMIDVVAVIPSDVGGFTIREMAALTEEGQAFAICNTPDTEKVIIASGAAGEVEVTMHIEYSNTGIISFIIDPNVVTATKKDLEKHNADPAAHGALFDGFASKIELNAHTNNSDIHVNPETMGAYDAAIADLIEHVQDTDKHVTAAEKAKWNASEATAEKAEADAAEALRKVGELESRVARVEDGLFNNITGNPYLVQFDSLEGIKLVKGIWNAARQRIEC